MTPEHIRAAVEGSCDALLALQLIRARTGTRSDAGVEPELSQAIDSLRHAIEELRSAYREDAGVLTLGFVVGARRGFKRPGRRSSVKPAPNRVDRGLDAAR